MATEHPRLLAASLTAALFAGVSCSTSGNSSSAPDDGAPVTARNETGEAPQPTAEALRAQEPQGPPSIDRQRRDALVAKYLEDGETLRAQGKLEAALLQLLKAKDLQPANDRVLAMIAAVQAELGQPVGTALDYGRQMQQRHEIAAQRRYAEVVGQLQTARQQMSEANYAGAVETLRLARINIESAPVEQDWKDLPNQLADLSAQAEKQLAEQTKAKQDEVNQELARRLAEQYRQDEARRRAAVDSLLMQSQLAFQQKRFGYAQDLALEALKLEPNNPIAFDLHTASVKAERDDATEDYYRMKAAEYRRMQESLEDLKIPQTEILVTDAATWARAQARSRAYSEDAKIDPADKATWEKVATAQVGKLSLTEENGAYVEVVKNLSLITGVPIIITPEAREVISSENLTMVVDLASSITLENFLNRMVRASTNLAWTVQNGVVLMGNKSQAAGTLQTRTYSVRDLVFKRTQFLPPRIRDIPSTDSGLDETPRTGGEREDKLAFVEMDTLQQNIKDATDPAYWEAGNGPELRAEDQGYLVVTCSPEMHRKVQSVLNDMRRFLTPAVSIDSKFLTITKNFLQQVGVDFRGLGGSGNKGDSATLDDVTNGLNNNASRGLDNGGTGDPAGNPLAGAFYNDGGDGDIRGRTENLFGDSLGRALTPNGGLAASWTYLNDLQFNMILQAVEKREDAEVLNSQMLTVMNNERAHVAVINQTAYVRDFDVEVAQAAFIADPKVDVIQDGIVLDVQPVIQQDRKYVILQLQPTVAELTRPIPTFTTSLAGSTLPVTLQLPRLTVTNFSTTVRVPDGGSVLLGGLRQVLTKERRAEIPILAQIPIVSFFFKQEGTSDENKSLMVLVRATITDVRDLALGK
ncbi:MAG: general secretion pathway protein GspD [Planctomycetota bacterium]